jgi:hypothetical protein
VSAVRRNLTDVPTKRPHSVPRTYLRAWANEDDPVAYRRRRQARAVVTNTTNVAVASGIYAAGEAAQAREQMFSQDAADRSPVRELCTTVRF